MSNAGRSLGFTESAAYRILLIRALETGPPSGNTAITWTDADAQWATRSVREDTGANANIDPGSYISCRADAAVGRLLSRTPDLAEGFSHRPILKRLPRIAAALALVLGMLSLLSAPGYRIDYILLYVFGFVAFQLSTMMFFVANSIAIVARGRPLVSNPVEALLASWIGMKLRKLDLGRSNIKGFNIDWARACSQLNSARAALTLHCASTAWALGMILGLWAMGLFKDYRAGWETTILQPTTVHALLEFLFAPAMAVTGTEMLDLESFVALRVMPGQLATGEGKIWIVLMSATLLLLAFLPRALFALLAWFRVHHLERQIPIDPSEPYFQRLLWRPTSGIKTVHIVTHGVILDLTNARRFQRWMSECFGTTVKTDFTSSIRYGEEDEARLPNLSADSAVMVVFDMLATPEAEVQGRLLHRVKEMAGSNPNLLVLLDSTRFVNRFASSPERVKQRSSAWQELTQSKRWPDPIAVPFRSLDDSAVIDAIRGSLPTAK